MECFVYKMPGGVLVPADESTAEFIDSISFEQGLRCKITRTRNIHFHRKFFAMLRVGYDAWEPPEVTSNHGKPEPRFERFRKDVTILAGYYEVSTRLNGDVVIEAESISFSRMEPEEFNRLYNAACNVLLKHVLHTYTQSDLDEHVKNIMGFS